MLWSRDDSHSQQTLHEALQWLDEAADRFPDEPTGSAAGNITAD